MELTVPAVNIWAVLLATVAAMVVGFLVTLLLPELPLRTTSGVQAQRAAGQGGGDQGAAAHDAAVAGGSSAPTSTAPTAAPTAPRG